MPARCRRRARCLSIGSNKDGAVEKTRTSKPFRALAPQASASTNSSTTAGQQRPVGAPLMRRGVTKTGAVLHDKSEGLAVGTGRWEEWWGCVRQADPRPLLVRWRGATGAAAP